MTGRARRWQAAVFAVIALGLLLYALADVPWLLTLAAVATVAYSVGRRHAQRQEPPPAVEHGNVVQLPSAGDSRTRRNGWTPPAARTVLLSADCATGDCGICTDRKCQHQCGHPALQSHPAAPPDDETPPF